MIFEPDKLYRDASTKAAKAKNGTLLYGDAEYVLTFNPNEWVYVVTLGDEQVVRFNVKSLRAAKAALLEWLST